MPGKFPGESSSHDLSEIKDQQCIATPQRPIEMQTVSDPQHEAERDPGVTPADWRSRTPHVSR